MQLNLNADLGESFGAWTMGDDASLLDIVDSANVACALHAGDPLTMRRTVLAAIASGVDIGAHPGFPDLQGFGRRPMALPPDELAATLQYQIGALHAIAAAHGAPLSHVKPHGALNNLACEDAELADTVVAAIAACRPDLTLLAPVFSALADSARRHGLPLALEVFADRAYTSEGHLVPRGTPGAVHDSTEACVAQVLRMLDAGGVVSIDGDVLPTRFHSVCVHGDNAHAVATAAAVREAVLAEGHSLAGLSQIDTSAG